MSLQKILELESSIANYNSKLSIIIQILIIYNCRISEVLSADWSNFFPDRYLILIGKKKSANIIVTDRILLKQISKLTSNKIGLIFNSVSYHQVKRHISKYYSHLFRNIKIKKNRKITHAFRYLNIANIDNDKIIKDILHHNSLKSGMYYKNKLKGS